MPRTCLLVLLDGLGDRPHALLGGKTPLQAAHTPFLDALAARSGCGMYHAGSLGECLPSEVAHTAIFGYPREDFPGRGPLEALGSGVDLAPGEVAVLAHFCCLEAVAGRARLLADKPVGVTPEFARELFAALPEFAAEGVHVRLVHTKGLFGVVILSGEVSPAITDTNPMVDGRWIPELLPMADSGVEEAAAARTARVLKRYLLEVRRAALALPGNRERAAAGLPPVDGLVTQRAGRLTPATPFAERFGMRGLSVASGAVYVGLARFLGLELAPDIKSLTDDADPGRELLARLRYAASRAGDCGFIHVHTKAPDQAAHAGDPALKARVIESLDAALAEGLGPLLRDPDLLVVVTADHSTPSSGALIHSGEAVPLLMHGEGVRVDGVDRFDEVACAPGCLGPVRGTELMALVLNHLDRARLATIRDTPTVRPYWPGDVEPFAL